MITYQVQYKVDMDKYQIKGSTDKPPVVGEAPQGTWKVIAELNSLKSALNSAKALIKKYGYENIRVCRSTKMNIKVVLES